MAGRTWLAVALACLVWFVYMKWFAPVQPTVESGKDPSTQQAKKPDGTAPIPIANESGKAGAFAIDFAKSTKVEIGNGDLRLSLSSAGGKIDHAVVSAYRETIEKTSEPIAVVRSNDTLMLATVFSDAKLRAFSNAEYQAAPQSNDAVTYRARSEGIEVEKEYKVADSGYFVQSKVRISFPDSKRKEWGYLSIPLGGNEYEYDAAVPIKAWELVAFQDGSVTRRNYDTIKEMEEVAQGGTKWLAFGNRYFSTAVVTESEINPDVVFSKQDRFVGGYLRYPLVLKEGNNVLSFSFQYYIGPKDVDRLSQVEGLKKLVDYGVFSFLAYPLLALMRFFYELINNWGVAIILLTVVVRLLFYPLSLKSYRSMKSMQKLQPHIKALREKYKDDMQRFNQEQMALFKAHKVNPMGGCLPILVQLPVFFALYTVLSNSIELFHAPFFWWIYDLSAKDPIYVFPILMGISMVVQQKMTPTAGMDPMQAKIMMIMPVIFTFIMLNLPSGLTIYIFLSTLLGIAQQWAINREPQKTQPKVAIVRSEGTSE